MLTAPRYAPVKPATGYRMEGGALVVRLACGHVHRRRSAAGKWIPITSHYRCFRCLRASLVEVASGNP